MPAQQYTLEDLEQIAQFQVGDELLDADGVPFDPPQYAQISDVQMAAGHEVGDEMSPGNMLPINSEVKEVVFFVDSSEDLQGVDAGAFDAGENASVASVASAYKAAQLFTQEDLEMLAGFQVGDELLNEDADGVPFDPQYAQISDVQMAAGHEVEMRGSQRSFGWDVTVEANSGVADGSVQLTFADGADIRDLAGNAANLDGVTSTSVTLDNVLPVISAEVMSVGGDDIISKADLDANQPVVVKVTGEVGPDGVFVELVSGSNHLAEGTFAVTAGYDPAIGEEFTLEVSGDVLQNASSISANVFTEDAAGNEGEGQSASFDYTVDVVDPEVASIVLSDSVITSDSDTTVTITFTEEISALSPEDLSLVSDTQTIGYFDNLNSSDGVVWTLMSL